MWIRFPRNKLGFFMIRWISTFVEIVYFNENRLTTRVFGCCSAAQRG